MPEARGVSLAERPSQPPPAAFLLTFSLEGDEKMEKKEVPIWEKANLTIKEAKLWREIEINDDNSQFGVVNYETI